MKQETVRIYKNKTLKNKTKTYMVESGLGGLVVSMLASGTQDRGVRTRPKPSDFSGEKKSTACLPPEGK
jgi:hypothetical protein